MVFLREDINMALTSSTSTIPTYNTISNGVRMMVAVRGQPPSLIIILRQYLYHHEYLSFYLLYMRISHTHCML